MRVAGRPRALVSQSLPAMLDPYLRGVTGHVAHPSRSIEIRSLPTLAHCFPRGPAGVGSLIPFTPLYLSSSRCARPLPRGITGHVAHPTRSIVSQQLPLRSTATSRHYRPCRSSHSLHCRRSQNLPSSETLPKLRVQWIPPKGRGLLSTPSSLCLDGQAAGQQSSGVDTRVEARW